MNESAIKNVSTLAAQTVGAGIIGGISGAVGGAIGSTLCNLVRSGLSTTTEDVIKDGAVGGLVMGSIVGGALAAHRFFKSEPQKDNKTAEILGGNVVKSMTAGIVGHHLLHHSTETTHDLAKAALIFALGGVFTTYPESFAQGFSDKLIKNFIAPKEEATTKTPRISSV